VGGESVDACVEESVLDLHERDHDGFGAFEDGEVDAGVLVGADGASETDAATFAAIPLVVEVAESLVTECRGAAFGAVGFDMGTSSTGTHRILSQSAIRNPQRRRKKPRRHEGTKEHDARRPERLST
jgi:hypothetical protein